MDTSFYSKDNLHFLNPVGITRMWGGGSGGGGWRQPCLHFLARCHLPILCASAQSALSWHDTVEVIVPDSAERSSHSQIATSLTLKHTQIHSLLFHFLHAVYFCLLKRKNKKNKNKKMGGWGHGMMQNTRNQYSCCLSSMAALRG